MPGPWLSPAHFPRWAVPSPLQKSPLIREAHGALHTCTGWGHTGVTVPCTSRSHSVTRRLSVPPGIAAPCIAGLQPLTQRAQPCLCRLLPTPRAGQAPSSRAPAP